MSLTDWGIMWWPSSHIAFPKLYLIGMEEKFWILYLNLMMLNTGIFVSTLLKITINTYYVVWFLSYFASITRTKTTRAVSSQLFDGGKFQRTDFEIFFEADYASVGVHSAWERSSPSTRLRMTYICIWSIILPTQVKDTREEYRLTRNIITDLLLNVFQKRLSWSVKNLKCPSEWFGPNAAVLPKTIV